MRARPHYAHVALEDVKQLREFVNAVFAKETAKSGNTRIVNDLESSAVALIHVHQAIFAGISIHTHGAEFIAAEFTAFSANTPCLIEDWTRGIDLDRNRGQQQQRSRNYQRNDADEKIHQALYKKPKSRDRLAIELQHRNRTDVIHAGADRETAVKVRHNFYADALAAGFKHNANHQVTADGRSEINLIDKIFGKNTGQIVWRSQAERARTR